jgi:pimeloyl-ACP methyl ester carboxylesterase
MRDLSDQLERLGNIVDYADYPWSRERRYEKTLEDSIAELDNAVERVKSKGATKIYLVGHSLGGNVLMYYATCRNDYSGIVLLCPSHNTHFDKFQNLSEWSVDQARQHIEQGIVEPQPYIDFQLGKAFVNFVKPACYFSYFNKDGNCNMATNGPKMPLDKPVFFAIGELDPATPDAKNLIYNPMVKASGTQYFYMLGQTHFGLPSAVVLPMIEWANQLSC